METMTRGRGGQLAYQVHDRISIPENVPALAVSKGDEGVVRDLALQNDCVTASVEVPYSTGQTRCWILVEIMPGGKVVSYTPGS